MILYLIGIAFVSQQYGNSPQFASVAWTYPDAQFKENRRKYDSLDVQGWHREVERVHRALNAAKEPSHDLIFRWLTISHSGPVFAGVDRRRIITGDPAFRKGIDAIHARPLPNSFEFTRAAFIQIARYDFLHPSLIPVGRRLLVREPRDHRLVATQLALMQPQAWPEHRVEGEKLVAILIKGSKAGQSDWQYRVGEFYNLCWMKSKSSVDRELAIKYFDAYLQNPLPERARKAVIQLKRSMDN